MMPVQETQAAALSRRVIQAFDNVNGYHPGFRPAHAKGTLLSGSFLPSLAGSSLTRAPHLSHDFTRVSVRFSDFAGIPTVPDYSEDASPRGCAIRFHLSEHVHTDILAHSVNAFPGRTAEEFAQFLEAIAASGAGVPPPKPITKFLADHPAALAFVQAPKPTPQSFATESFFGVNAYKFTNEDGKVQFGRYRILPDGPNIYLDSIVAKSRSDNFLFDEIRQRLMAGPVKMHILVQLAAEGDLVHDSTVHWPDERPIVHIGTLYLTGVHPDDVNEQRHIIFDPIPRVDGIDSSDDPLLQPRADAYLMSGRRRRAAVAQ